MANGTQEVICIDPRTTTSQPNTLVGSLNGLMAESPGSSTAPPYEGPRRQFSEEELSVTYQPPGYPNFLIGPRNSVRESGVLAFCIQSLEVNHLNLGLSEPMSYKYFSRILLENILDQTDRGRSCDSLLAMF